MAFDMAAFDPLNDPNTPRANGGAGGRSKPPTVAIPGSDSTSWVSFDAESPAIVSRGVNHRHKRSGTEVGLPISLFGTESGADDMLNIPTSQVRGHGRTRSVDSPMANPFDIIPATEPPHNQRHVPYSIGGTSGAAAAKGAGPRRRSSLPPPESPAISKIDRVFFPDDFGDTGDDDSDAEEYDRPTSPSPPPPAPPAGIEPLDFPNAGAKTPKHHAHHKHRHRHHRRRHREEYGNEEDENRRRSRNKKSSHSSHGHGSHQSRKKSSTGKQRLKVDATTEKKESDGGGSRSSGGATKKKHRRAASAMSPVAAPPGHHFWAKLDMPAVPKVDKTKVAEVFSPRTKARQSAELDEFDSDSDGEEYIFDDELDAWRPKNGSTRKSKSKAKSSSGSKNLKAPRQTRRRSSQPCVPGVSANSAEHVHMRLQNLQFGVEIVDTEKFLAGSKQRILFIQRGYFRGDWLERLDFIFESSQATPVVVGVKIFKHGPNMFKTPTGQDLDYRKRKYFKWKVDPGDRLHCLTATRDPDAEEAQKKSNKMGFSYLVGHKHKTKWYWS